MKALTAALLAAATLFATLPGIATLSERLEAPPNYHTKFGAYLLAVGVLTLLLMSLWKRQIQHLPRKRVAAYVLTCIPIALLAFTIHDEVYRKTVVTEEVARDTTNQVFDSVTVFFPLRLSGRLKQWADSAGGREQIFQNDHHSIHKVKAEVERYSRSSTVLLLLLLRMASVLPLVTAFAVAGWAVAARGGARSPPQVDTARDIQPPQAAPD